MTILLKVYGGWTRADEDAADWSVAFPDSASPEDIARELFNREQDKVECIRSDFPHVINVVNWAMKYLEFDGFTDHPGTQLSDWRIVKIGRV
jgi:hypothetical protein